MVKKAATELLAILVEPWRISKLRVRSYGEQEDGKEGRRMVIGHTTAWGEDKQVDSLPLCGVNGGTDLFPLPSF